MNNKHKKPQVFAFLLLFSIVVLAIGLKYSRVFKPVKLSSGVEKEIVGPGKTQNQSPHTLSFDFEVAPGKDMPGGFYKGQAHSGQYAVKAFGENSFSVSVERTAREVGVENLNAVAISAWIYVFPTKKDVKGSLVFTASDAAGKNVCWHGLALVDPEVPKGKWFHITGYFDLTAVKFQPDYKLQMYFWNTSSTDILIDDYFISFGGPVDRRGDSARVDMTKPAGYIAKYNYPPFPVSFLEKDSLIKTLNPADIDQDDLAISGDFLTTGNDGLLVVKKDGRAFAYAFCQEKREFRKVALGNQPALALAGRISRIIKARFLSNNADQFLVIGEKGWFIGALEPPDNPCNKVGAMQTALKILWKSDTPATSIYPGDFNGDQRTEILMVTGNGSWKVMSFVAGDKTGGSLTLMAADDGKPVTAWDRSGRETAISTGRFLPGLACDVVLTVTRNISGGEYTYSLLKLDLPGRKWEPVFGKKQDYAGKTIGLDTLKPSDIFFAVSTNETNTTIFRYNRDWRFDLKEIRFNDSCFTIVSGVDFHGYDKDQNPKYYESLKLVPGYFLASLPGSFLAVGHVLKSRQYQETLPDFVHLYSLPVNK